jgi:hypothetical protein
MSYQPYTHSDHFQRCIEAAQIDQTNSSQLVQVRKAGIVYCAQLLQPLSIKDGPDCWVVESITPQVAIFTVSVRNTVLCGLVGCTCVRGQA